MTGSNAGDSYDDSDRAYPAASNRPQSSEGQDREHLLQQRELRADEGPAFAKSGIEGRGIRRTGAMGGAAGGGPESADGRPEANESKHAGKHGRQQQQQSPRSGSTDGAAGSGTSPHKHIGVPFSLAAVDPVEAATGVEELYLPEGVLRQMETALPVANPSTQSQETDLEVGRWGEELVYRFLLQHQRDSAQAWQVHWVNQAFNTGTPYDISLRAPDGTEQFIEVKSSLALSKAFFEMSHQEVEMAQRLSNQYSLYRVTGAGTTSPTLLRITNPIQKWAAGHIKVCVVV